MIYLREFTVFLKMSFCASILQYKSSWSHWKTLQPNTKISVMEKYCHLYQGNSNFLRISIALTRYVNNNYVVKSSDRA